MKRLYAVLLVFFMVFGSAVAAFAAAPADGTYSVETTLQGGSGRTSVKSPSTLTVSGGQMSATVVFNSSNFTWMKVNGVTYNNSNPGGNSTFTIPVSALDTGISVSAQTVAMSEPHVIDYVIKFSSAGTASQGKASTGSGSASSDDGGISDDAKESEAGSDDPDDEEKEDVIVSESNSIEVNNTMSNSTSVSENMLSDCGGKTMSLMTTLGKVEFDEKSLSEIAKAAKGGVTLEMKDVTDELADRGYTKAVEVTLTDDEGNDLASEASDGEMNVTVNIDDTLSAEGNLKVFFVTGSEESEIDSDVCDDYVTFKADELGTFAIEKPSETGFGIYAALGIAAAVTVIGATAYFVRRGKRKE